MWPVGLGASDSEDVRPMSFSVFMALYTLISFPVLSLQLEFALGILSWPVRIGALVVGQAIVQGVLLAEVHQWSIGSIKIARTYGNSCYGIGLWVVFAVQTLSRGDPLDKLQSIVSHSINTGGNATSTDACSMATAAGDSEEDDVDVGVGVGGDPKRERVHSRAYLGIDGSTEAQLARLVAFEDTSFAGASNEHHLARPIGAEIGADVLVPASPNGTEERLLQQDSSLSAGAIDREPSADALLFQADTSVSLHVQSISRLFAPLLEDREIDSFDRDTLLEMEQTYCAIQLRCPRSAWYLARWTRHPAAMLLFASLSSACMWGNFFFVQWCAIVLFASNENSATRNAHTVLESVGRYALFASVVIGIGFVAKRFARGSDALKTAAFARARFPDAVAAVRAGGALPASVLDPGKEDPEALCEVEAASLVRARFLSMEMVQHVMVCYFFAIFFRVLFQQLETWSQFIAVSVAHLAVVAIGYPLRMTRAYFQVTDALQSRFKGVPLLGFVFDPSNGAQWNTRIAVDFMVHFSTAITATFAFLAATAFLRFGYNRGRYQFFGAELSSSDFNTGMIFVAAGAVVELASAGIMAVCTRGLVRGGISAPMTKLMRAVPWYQIFLVCGGAHVITDVFLAHVKLGPSQPTGAPANATASW